MTTEDRWRKARRSQNNANCVELNNTLDQIRDSKNTTGPTLSGDVPALLGAVSYGSLWHKARRSVNNANCVEVNNTLDQLRDSKNTAGPALHADLPGLVRAVRAGRLDR